jgi:hypothetical protein
MPRFLVFLTLVIISYLTNAQEVSKSELEIETDAHFQAQNYSMSIIGYEKLMDVYPKEAKFNYCLGVSYLEGNVELEKSVKYLKYAASRSYTPEVHFYLAKAYYRNYQFNEADISLQNFKNLTKKKLQENLGVPDLELAIDRLREEVYMVKNYSVLSSEKVKSYQIEGVYRQHVSGKFKSMPDAFMSKTDITHAHQGLMYFPLDMAGGTSFYISSYGKSGRQGKDIFKIEQITALDYTFPINLMEINSSANEAYAYFDNANQTLYFSSDRAGGLGGYDIYRSTLNMDTKEFSEPVALEFPVNSAYDDYLFVPDSLGESSIFLSNRSVSGNNLMAYKIVLSDTLDYVFPKSQNEIHEIAMLSPAEDESPLPIIQKELHRLPPAPELTSYEKVLQSALLKQVICDSLLGELVSIKNRLRITNDENGRRVLFSSIAAKEKDLFRLQEEADELFRQARDLRGEREDPLLAESKKDEGFVSFSHEVDDIKIYSFKPEMVLNLKTENSKTPMISYSETTSHNKKTIASKFSILQSSPYNSTHPIPVNEELPSGLVYRIQLGVFGNKLPLNAFGGLSPVSAEILEERQLTKYYVGYFTSSEEAKSALSEVKGYGFNDAFIVSYFEKKKISINEAREIEFSEKLDIE